MFCIVVANVSNTFLIVSLIRSRTTWLANLFTTDRTYCSHENYGYTGKYLPNIKKEYIGSTFSGADIRDIDTTSFDRIAIISRPVDEVIESAVRAFTFPKGIDTDQARALITEPLRTCDRALDSISGDNVKLFLFEELEDTETIGELWEWLTPNVPFDIQRTALLQGFLVNTKDTEVLEEIK